MVIRIERARIEDVDAVKRVLSETWHDTYGGFLPSSTIERITTQWHAPARLQQQIEDSALFFGVARDRTDIAAEPAADTIVGIITARPQQAMLDIGRLYVLPTHQRRGIGQQLLQASYQAFPTVARVRVEVEAQNEKGVAFYRKQGFQEVDRRVDQIGETSLQVMVMEKRLRPKSK